MALSFGVRCCSTTTLLGAALLASVSACSDDGPDEASPQQLAQGQQIFRFDTYGDETFWTDTLRMHEVISSRVSPATALRVGLKVDADALPAAVAALQSGRSPQRSPATTVALLKLNAVVGSQGHGGDHQRAGHAHRVGITCALCHSTVNNSLRRASASGWTAGPTSISIVGAIIALSPALTGGAEGGVQLVGPGQVRPPLQLRRAERAGRDSAGLRAARREQRDLHRRRRRSPTGTATSASPRCTDTASSPSRALGISVAQPARPVESKLAGSRRLSAQSRSAGAACRAPSMPPRPRAGRAVFKGPGQCATCHAGTTYTDANTRLHAAESRVAEPTPTTRRGAPRRCTAPRRFGRCWQHAPYFHDGSAATLDDVVDRYDSAKNLQLTPAQKADLVEYLKSL